MSLCLLNTVIYYKTEDKIIQWTKNHQRNFDKINIQKIMDKKF